MSLTLGPLFYGAAIIFFVLWFMDEIISLRNIKKYGEGSAVNPLLAWFMHHHAKRIIYIKILFYAGFTITLSSVIERHLELFYTLNIIFLVVYLAFDIVILQKYRTKSIPRD